MKQEIPSKNLDIVKDVPMRGVYRKVSEDGGQNSV
jgi:hypothetical protein